MTEASSSATSSAIEVFGDAFLNYLRNLTPQVVLLSTYALAEIQAAWLIEGKLPWKMFSVTCLVMVVVAAFFNIVVFMRKAVIADPYSAEWFIAKFAALLMVFPVSIAFIAAAIFSSRSLLRSIVSFQSCGLTG